MAAHGWWAVAVSGAPNGRASAPGGARAGATCAGCWPAAPYRRRVSAMLTALVLGTAASLAPAPLAKLAIDDGIDRHDVHTLVLVVIAFLASALIVWAMTYAQTYLVDWVGQRALADLRIAHLHPPAAPAGRLLRAPPRRRADLAHDQRRRGARQRS